MFIRSTNWLLRDAVKKCGVPALAISGGLLLAPYASSQTTSSTASTSDQKVEEVIVSGVREAIKTSQEIKKEADTVVDSITASDIGAFPDKSVAEALQRVPGIFVNRFASTGDTTHFSAEPSGVVIRGLPQVRSEFNGRDSFNANSSRGLSFADVPPELMAGVDTYKNSTADMVEGGIAGTINLRTHVPFDASGFRAAFSAKADYGDLSEDINPAGSMLISDRWTTGIGDFGLLANAAYSKVSATTQGVQILRYFRVDGVSDNGYGGGTNWIPGGADVRESTYDRTRKGGAFAAQWRSPDESLLATLQFNRSDYQNDLTEHSLSGSIGNSQTAQSLILTSPLAVPAEGTPDYEFDSRGVFTRGVLNDMEGSWAGANSNPQLSHPDGFMTPDWAGSFPNWFCYSWSVAPGTTCPTTRGIGLSADTRFGTTREVTEDLSLNLKWTVNDRVGLNFDLQHIDSNVDNFDNSSDAKTASDVYLDLTGSRPKIEFRAPTGFGFTEGGFADPRNYYHEWTMEHVEQSEGEEWAGRIDADIDIHSGWLDSLRVGLRRAEREQNVNYSTYNWGSVQPLWGVQSDEAFFLTQGRWTNTYQTNNFGSGLLGGGVFGGGEFVHPDLAMVKNYQNTLNAFSGHSNDWVPLGSRTTCPVEPGSFFCPVEMQDIQEDVDAAYVMLKFGGEDTKIGSIGVRGNIGVRNVTTKVNAGGGIQYRLLSQPSPWQAGQGTNPRTLLSAQDISFMNGGTIERTAGDDNENWLPSLNVRFGLTPDMFIRFAASRALARADMGLYKYYMYVQEDVPSPNTQAGFCASGTVTYSVPGDCSSEPVAYTPHYSGNIGNPKLKPTTADQVDLTWEWYFSDTSSLTAALFYKKFNNYLVTASYTQEFTNAGVTRPVSVTGPANGEGAAIQGFEVAYRTFFDMLPSPWNGFGIEVNYTFVDNKGIENTNLSSVPGTAGSTQQDPLITFTNLPLEGFSKNAYNLIARYDKDKVSARLAYNWRDKFMQTQSDCCIKLPIWQDDYGQLDGSFHFQATESLDLFAEAQNLTNAETVLMQQVTNEGMLLPRSWFTQDRRYQLGVRYSFK
ncbi:MAG: TonB-dependent receptor [Povalibacter sp.]